MRIRSNFTLLFSLLFLQLIVICPSAYSANTLVGLTTDGRVLQIDPTTGALTVKINDQITNFELGAIARKADLLYYVAVPPSSTQRAIYTVNLKTSATAHVDLDRSDDVRALFLDGKKLYGVFYNGTLGTLGVYKINALTGVTTLVADFAPFHLEPVAGAFARIGKFFYIIVKPTSDTRQLVRFRLKAGAILTKDILSASGAPILCDRIKAHPKLPQFVCLASPTSSEVDICKLKLNGRATCTNPLTNTLRLASGHTMVTDGKNYYALTYTPDDPNTQHLVKFKANGKEIASPALTTNTLFVGIRFGKEDEPPPAE